MALNDSSWLTLFYEAEFRIRRIQPLRHHHFSNGTETYGYTALNTTLMVRRSVGRRPIHFPFILLFGLAATAQIPMCHSLSYRCPCPSPMCESIGHRPLQGRCPKTGGKKSDSLLFTHFMDHSSSTSLSP